MSFKKYIVITCCLLFSLVVKGQKQNLLVDKIVAKVGGEIIFYSDVQNQYAYLHDQMLDEEISKCEILKNLIAQKLLVNQAKLDSIPVTDAQVEVQLDARINNILRMMNNDVARFESYYGKTIDQVKSQMRDAIKDQLLGQQMRNKIIDNVEASPEQTKAFFESLPKDSIPYYNAEVQLSELVFKPIISKDERQKAIDKLKDIKKRILSGDITFKEAASIYSQDYASARVGGDLGMMQRGSLVREYEAAAYNLDKGEISDIVKSEYGYHLIKLIERRGNNIHTRHILIKPELTDEDLAYSIKKLDSIRHLIVIDSISFKQAVSKYGYENVQSYNNGGGMLNPKSGNAYFEVGELDPDVYFAIDTIDVGGITAPIKYKKRDGTVMLRLIKLVSMTEPHKASLTTDYAKIKELANQELQFEAYKEWIEKTLGTTFVAIYPPFKDCTELQAWLAEHKDQSAHYGLF